MALFLFLVSSMGCQTQTEPHWRQAEGYRWAPVDPGSESDPGFNRLPTSATGVDVTNRLTDAEIDENQHLMNGSGVATGDVDGDGLPDLYFAQLNGPNKLYKNIGGFEFRNVTDSANVAHEDYYSTGTTFADIDGDGDLDLLVGSMSKGIVIYTNDGEGHFSKQSQAFEKGKGNSTLALADVDGDSDLDLYVTNYKERSAEDIYARDEIATNKIVRTQRTEDGIEASIVSPFDDHFAIVGTGEVRGPAETGEVDALYLNQGDGTFRKVRDDENRFLTFEGEPAGLAHDWGLNASFRDINDDGLPDLYVNNDFWTPDRVWLNQGNGVFQAMDPLALRNQSFSSMTVDFSDVDRDGALDFFVTEMLSSKHSRRLRQYTPQGPFPADQIRNQPQYNRNSLYLNRGDDTFAEVSYFSGVEATGWSWGVRFLDVDLDGYEDLIVNTGFSHDVQDMDSRREMGRKMKRAPEKRFITQYPQLHLQNEAFRNQGDRTFVPKSEEWGFGTAKDVSHGLSTADFDRDGDLDVVVNRLNKQAVLYENEAAGARIAVRLSGTPPNTDGIGAQVTLDGGPGGGAPQQREMSAGGDYLSGSTPMLMFAAEEGNPTHRISVTWPNGTTQVLDSVRANRIYDIRQRGTQTDSTASPVSSGSKVSDGQPPIFEDVSERLSHQHHENAYDDFRLQPLLPKTLSRQGPGVSWIDYDKDGDEDLLIGTGKGGTMGVYQNDGTGTFTPRTVSPLTDTASVDQTTILGWPTEEGTQLVVGLSNYETRQAKMASGRQYWIEGGRAVSVDSIPGTWSATGPLAAADYDDDGDVDLFVGGRVIRGQYPWDASSRLFENQEGTFRIDAAHSDRFANLGLVTGAVFTDYDVDGDPDLLISRAWDSLKLYENEEGTFRDVTESVGLSDYKGWWNGVTTGDFTGNGRPDIVATNWGTNSPYQMESERPLKMYYADFNKDRLGEIIESHYSSEREGYVPRRKRSAYQSTPVPLTAQGNSFRQFAGSTLQELLRGGAGRALAQKEINTLTHTLFLNEGDQFSPRSLPPEAQFTTAYHAGVADYNADGNEDLFLSQNFFGVRPKFPRQDVGRGLWLEGEGDGTFTPIPGHESGVTVYGEQRGAALGDVNDDGRVDLVVSQNGAATKLFLNRFSKAGMSVHLDGPPSNQAGIGSSLRLLYENGTAGPRREVRAGGGYWSQRSYEHVLGRSGTVEHVEVRWSDGRVDTVGVSEGEKSMVIRHPEWGD